MALTSLIIKIGAKDEEIQKALTSVGQQAKSLDADLSKLGNTPVGIAAQKSLEQMQKSMASVTEAQQKLADRAVNMARGMEIVGGATKFTSDELNAMSRTVTKGIDAFRALGATVPPEVAKATKAISAQQEALKAASGSWDNFVKGFNIESAISNPLGTAKAAVFAFTESIGGVALAAAATVAAIVAVGVAAFKLAANAAAVGGNLDDMADKTEMSVPALSRLQNAAKVAGTDLGTLTNAVFMVQQRMGEGGAKWEKAMADMGLSTEVLRAAGPDRLLETITAGLDSIKDPSDRAAAGVAVMGRSFKDVKPILADLNAALLLTNDIQPWTAQQAKDAEEFEMQMRSLVVHVEALGMALGRDLIPYVSGFVSVAVDVGGTLARLVGRFSGITSLINLMGGAWSNAAAAINVFRKSVEKIPPVTGDAAKGVEKWKQSVSDMAPKVRTLEAALIEEEFASKALAAQHAELTKAHNASTEATKKAAAARAKFVEEFSRSTDAVQKLESGFFGLTTAVGAFDTKELDAVKASVELRAKINEIERSAHIANFGFKGMADGLKTVGDQVDLVAPKLHRSLGDAFKEIPNILQAAFTGGGGVGGALKAIAVNLGVEFAKTLNDSIKKSLASGGGGFNAVTGKAAAATGAIAGLGAAMSGASGKAASASAAMAGVSVAAGAIGTGATIGGALALGAATAGIGLAAVGAYIVIKKFLTDTEKKINPVREQFVQLHGGLDALNKKAAAAGLTLAATLNAKTPQAYNAAINQLNDAFRIQEESTAALNDAIQRYGFSIEELGPALQRQELGKQAEQIFKDWSLLNAAGINTVAIAGRMAESINAYVQRAVSMGIEVPAAMKPMLQSMIDEGKLTDAAGNKIASLEELGVSFSQTMTEGFKSIVDEVKKLAEAISGRLGTAIANIPTSINIPVNLNAEWHIPAIREHFVASGGLVTERGIQHFAAGGVVLPFRRRGTDSQPAMLTPGEIILNEAQQKHVAGAMSGGARVSTAAMEHKLDTLNAYLTGQFSRDVARANRDELQKIVRRG